MQIKSAFFIALILLLNVCAFAETTGKEQLARQAVSEDAAEAKAAVEELRALGQEGLDALLAAHWRELGWIGLREMNEKRQKISAAIDGVAMQKDAYASRLYWFTDLEKAKIEAQKTGKPILSLRLLGNLNEEFSCANSRFFRAVLYPNDQISKTLREKYVLHWKSVRPAPRITVDFGDGRRIERTVTGNSIHYLLDAKGNVVDALPGLNSPHKFLRFLENDWTAKQSANLTEKQRAEFLTGFHQAKRDGILLAWETTLKNLKVTLPAPQKSSAKPTAIEAAARAVTKSATELVLVEQISFNDFKTLNENTNLESWRKIAASFAEYTELDSSALYFIRQQTLKSGLSEAEFKKLAENLRNSIALDTARNEYLFETKIHEWLAANPSPDLEKFNEKVYAELFLTPSSDKWLGLYSSDIYVALDGGGIIK